MSGTFYPCYGSYLKTLFQLLLYTSALQLHRKCLGFWPALLPAVTTFCIPRISSDNHRVLCKLERSNMTAGFTEWYQEFSQILSERKVYCNSWWYFITASAISCRQFTLLAEEQIKREMWTGSHLALSCFIFLISLNDIRGRMLFFHIIWLKSSALQKKT